MRWIPFLRRISLKLIRRPMGLLARRMQVRTRDAVPRVGEFVAQRGLVHRFEEARAEGAVDLNGGLDDDSRGSVDIHERVVDSPGRFSQTRAR